MAHSRTPGKNGSKYQPQFGIIILCADVTGQAWLYERLKAQGYKLKVVMVSTSLSTDLLVMHR